MEEKDKEVQDLDEGALDGVTGGYVGKDKFDQATYNKYGITHQHNIWSKDKYWYQGNEISQKVAERKVQAAIDMGSKGVNQVYDR